MQLWRVTPDAGDERRGRIEGPLFDAPCALGKHGVTLEGEKREGDGKTPIGTYSFRQIFYRPDKVEEPVTVLPVTPISPELGWCDDPADERYNKLVRLPFQASHETLWRDDNLYDLVLVIGHNDDPPVPDLGSAIFVHVAGKGFAFTEGCVALAPLALQKFLRLIRPEDRLQIG